MREILFRARTVSESEYMDDGEWVEGFYTCFNGEEHRIYTGYSETDCGDHYPDWFTVLPETVGQFTGLTDKNGTKIFEGDIIRNEPSIIFSASYKNPVVFDDGEFYGEGSYVFLASEFKYCEVIGNIHDNPELLERSNKDCFQKGLV